MAPALSPVDFVILLFGLCVLIGIGVYFWRGASSPNAFFTAHRSLSAFPIGISATRTLLASLPAYGLLNEAYFAGIQVLVLPILLWCCWPLVTGVILPLYIRLNVVSIYEYLELRFDSRVRRTAAMVSVLWRFAWLVSLLAGTGIVLGRMFAEPSRVWLLILLLGVTYTLYSLLGGLRAVLWAGVLQALLALSGVALVIVSIWQQLDGGPHRVADIASATGRTALLELRLEPARSVVAVDVGAAFPADRRDIAHCGPGNLAALPGGAKPRRSTPRIGLGLALRDRIHRTQRLCGDGHAGLLP